MMIAPLHKKITTLITLSLSLLLVQSAVAQQSDNFEVGKNIEIYLEAYRTLNNFYVDDLEPEQLMKDGLDNMLKSLDPYTVFIPESEIEDYKMITTGEYGGIGSLTFTRNDTIMISEPYEDSPTVKCGLQAGDKIIRVGNKSVVGIEPEIINGLLKGEAGTTISLTIMRGKEVKVLDIDREIIKLNSVTYFGVVGQKYGYIKLDQFTQFAGQEVKTAFVELEKEHKIKGLILDLRGNGGGLLEEAVNIVNIFYNKGAEVVSTKGRIKELNQTFRTRTTAVNTKIPLVVIVDQGSASASEIVAGALQDLDRAVIIGQRTFGKGLVQNVVPLNYNTQMKITVSKYYIPSGRCIQAIDYSHKDETGNWNTVPDSLLSTFYTKGGRAVKDGAGIAPDLLIEPSNYHDITYALYSKHLAFDFVVDYHTTHEQIAPIEEFEITDEIWENFKAYIALRDYAYTTNSEKLLTEVIKMAETENADSTLITSLKVAQTEMEESKTNDLDRFETEIKQLLEMEFATQYYYQKGRIQAVLKKDRALDEAIEVLGDSNQYDALLAPISKKK